MLDTGTIYMCASAHVCVNAQHILRRQLGTLNCNNYFN